MKKYFHYPKNVTNVTMRDVCDETQGMKKYFHYPENVTNVTFPIKSSNVTLKVKASHLVTLYVIDIYNDVTFVTFVTRLR